METKEKISLLDLIAAQANKAKKGCCPKDLPNLKKKDISFGRLTEQEICIFLAYTEMLKSAYEGEKEEYGNRKAAAEALLNFFQVTITYRLSDKTTSALEIKSNWNVVLYNSKDKK